MDIGGAIWWGPKTRQLAATAFGEEALEAQRVHQSI